MNVTNSKKFPIDVENRLSSRIESLLKENEHLNNRINIQSNTIESKDSKIRELEHKIAKLQGEKTFASQRGEEKVSFAVMESREYKILLKERNILQFKLLSRTGELDRLSTLQKNLCHSIAKTLSNALNEATLTKRHREMQVEIIKKIIDGDILEVEKAMRFLVYLDDGKL